MKQVPQNVPVDSINGNGFETNLFSSLKELRSVIIDDRIKSVTLISDGNFTSGENPVSEVKLFQCPFNVIAVGDSVQKKDILVNRVNYNPKAFIKTSVRISVQIDAFLCKGEIAEINLFKEGAKISSNSVPVTSDEFSAETGFEVMEQNPGIVRYQVSIAGLKNEITNRNNSYNFLIDFIDNSTRLLFISGGPGYDNAFLRNIIKRIEDYKLNSYTLKSPGSFYEGNIDNNIYADLSAVFFYNFPVSAVQNNIVSEIADNVQKFKIPLIIFAGKNTDYPKLSLFEESLPFSLMKTNSGESNVNLQVVAKTDNSGLEKDLNGLPPLYKNISGIVQKTGTEVLLMDKNSGEPIMINRNSDKFNATAFLGYGFWKWRLNDGQSNEKALEKLVTNSVSITLNKEKKQRVKLETPKDEFDYLENIVITGTVTDENYNPTQNAILKGKLKGQNNNSDKEILFTSSNNNYSSDLGILPPDDYTLEAEGNYNNQSLGKDVIRFIVDTTSSEFKTTKSDYNALKSLAENSGGKFYNIDENTKLEEIISASTKNVTPAEDVSVKYERFNFWENRYILLAIVLLLSIEWFVKKRKNIP